MYTTWIIVKCIRKIERYQGTLSSEYYQGTSKMIDNARDYVCAHQLEKLLADLGFSAAVPSVYSDELPKNHDRNQGRLMIIHHTMKPRALYFTLDILCASVRRGPCSFRVYEPRLK